MAKRRTAEIRRAILEQVFWASGSPVPPIADRFHVTRQAVQKHVRALVQRRQIVTTGTTRVQRFRLRQLRHIKRRYALSKGFSEDVAWEQFVRPKLTPLALSGPTLDLCGYGLTEMANNVLDHSAARYVEIMIARTAISLQMWVTDNGVGIFQKVSKALRLADPRAALLELVKGKFTTDPERHTGQGVFFTSRMFDRFAISSGKLQLLHELRHDTWSILDMHKSFRGTHVLMELLLPSSRTLQEIFSQYDSGPDDFRFDRTTVPLRLAAFGDESLLSRSSAKRVMSRAESFDEVELDFTGIRTIGQAFADEIFRVFQRAHPRVTLRAVHANADVGAMIRRALAGARKA